MATDWHVYRSGALPGLALAALAAGCTSTAGPGVTPPGTAQGVKQQALEAGAAVLQTDAPLDPMNVYVVGFHPMKDDPAHQMTAHHFCNQVNADFLQCALFDGNGRNANLTGIEYIISERLFETLPQEERRYWHPHNYEILSGTLMAPGIPGPAEHALMQSLMNSYGKTWHTWSTGDAQQPGDQLPLGPAMLAWSANRDGEILGRLIKQRDQTLGTDTEESRRGRRDLVGLARPQDGVDSLAGKFPWPTYPIAGVTQLGAPPAAERAPGGFAALDSDGDGEIARAEAAQNAELLRAWPRADLDGNDALDRSEFAAFEQREALAEP